MSSEISIDAGGLKTKKRRPKVDVPPHAEAPPEESFKPWHFFVLASILLATVGVMLTRQSSPENLILISLTIAAAGTAAAAFYKMLVPLTQHFVETSEVISERGRAALEREKMLVLRSIKELEFDRAMGKLSQKDFDEMVGRLRARALTLMRQLDADESVYTTTIETELRARLADRLRTPAVATAAAPRGAARWSCTACASTNDADAVFCKKCGARLAE
jgi:hypothetical protein